MTAARRSTTVLLVLALALGLGAAVPGAPADGAPATTSVWGPTVHETLVEVSRDAYPDGATEAVLVGADAPIMAYGAPVLAAHRGAPILSLEPDRVPAATRDELARLGVERVTIVAGGVDVDTTVDRQLRAAGYQVARRSGATRDEAAASIARETAAPGDTVVAVPGDRFDLAFAGASEAIRVGGGLLVTGQVLSGSTREALRDLRPDRIVVLGDDAAMPRAVLDDLRTFAPRVERLATSDAAHAAYLVAQRHGIDGRELTVATSSDVTMRYGGSYGTTPAMAAMAAYDGPFLYADADPVLTAALDHHTPSLVRLVGDAKLRHDRGEVTVSAYGYYRTAAGATSGQPVAVVLPGTGGTVSAAVVERERTPSDAVPVEPALRVAVPSAAAAPIPTLVNLQVDVADLPAGTGRRDVVWRRDGAVLPTCPQGGEGPASGCVWDHVGDVDDDLVFRVVLRDGGAATYEAEVAPLVRRAGTDRYETGHAVATQIPLLGTDEVYVATGQDFPDALAAAAAAGAQGSRVLITPGTPGDGRLAAAIGVLGADGAAIVGGERVVADGAVTSVDTVRLDGANRFDTAAQVAARVYPDGATTVYLATGRSYPDALTGAVSAARADAPVLLTEFDRLPEETLAALRALSPSRVVVVGGTAVVSEAVEAEVQALGATTERRAGVDRFDTAARVSRAAFPWASVVFLATGENFADALTAAPLAAQSDGPLLLATRDGLPEATVRELQRLQPRRVVILGGEMAIGAAVEQQVTQLLR